MNLLIFIPVLVLVLIALYVFYRRKGGRAESGLGDRRDRTERPELRGTEQGKQRPEFGGTEPNERHKS